jgi:hypothetical protein
MIEWVTSGIDWMSTTLGVERDGYHEWRRDAFAQLEVIARDGGMIKTRRLLGYEGLSSGNCFVGDNGRETYAQFTGERAHYAFDAIYHEQAKVSRLDLQVTVKTDVMNKNEGKRCYRAAIDANEGIPDGRRRKVWIIVGSDGGDTCYIGSASSEQRARIYNKEVQSEDIQFTRCWRYEVVLRNELSSGAARHIASTARNREKCILDFVVSWLARRGVVIAGLGADWGTALPIERTRPTDIEAKLRWLKTQVAPTIKYLCEAGYRDTIIEMLFPEEQIPQSCNAEEAATLL